MTSEERAGQDWSDREIDLIVADYFDMLALELRGESYVKTRRNAELQRLTGRTRSSIEFKHRNISAVLLKLGEPWILGYKPLANFQGALLNGVERFLDVRPAQPEDAQPSTGLAETDTLFVGAPPELQIWIADTNPALERLVRKFDPAARDARNRMLGQKGEERVVRSEKARLRAAGRDDLATKVEWVSRDVGDGAGYDVLSFGANGQTRLLEVKTTTGAGRTPFFLSRNEKGLSEERPNEFRIFRLYDFAREPKAFVIRPPLEDRVILEASVYRASFG